MNDWSVYSFKKKKKNYAASKWMIRLSTHGSVWWLTQTRSRLRPLKVHTRLRFVFFRHALQSAGRRSLTKNTLTRVLSAVVPDCGTWIYLVAASVVCMCPSPLTCFVGSLTSRCLRLFVRFLNFNYLTAREIERDIETEREREEGGGMREVRA